MLNEKLQPNKVNAPTLFVGLGGQGSKVVAGVADLCKNDDTSNIRFVAMDTDVNDLIKINKSGKVIAIQTSSTNTVGEYLKNDKEAHDLWFPANKMLEDKPISEGAGQIRAISRLALNATVKQGHIALLYRAIDDLFLKDGGNFKQAIRVVIASTAAGGTGSGIAMEVGMLIRHYIKKNYPEAAVMIRGFLIMPGVMDTVIERQSERESVRCNGYATIKEVNAFMMKGSGFFDTVPELKRYKDLHMVLPGTSSGDEKLSGLPFDFCFLMDRTDANTGNMPDIQQYLDFASRSLYEQNIGPMSTRANSMEDNVLKLCISPETLGRCRFGGVGASALVYPYENIRDYIALNWARATLIGSSSDENLDENQRKQLMKNSWLQYDAKFEEELKEYLDNPNAGGVEPKLEKSYVNAMNEGKDAASGDNYTAKLWQQYLIPKEIEISKGSGANAVGGVQLKTLIDHIGNKKGGEAEFTSTQKVARAYLSRLIEEVVNKKIQTGFSGFNDSLMSAKAPTMAEDNTHEDKYNAIDDLETLCHGDRLAEIATTFARGVFTSKSPVSKEGLGDFMLERFISIDGKAMHPNAVRYMLYELLHVLQTAKAQFKKDSDMNEFERILESIKAGVTESGTDIEKFQVKSIKALGKENNLKEMCISCDKANLFGGSDDGDACEEQLRGYFETVQKCYISIIGYAVCEVAIPAVTALSDEYRKFFSSFEDKVPSIESKKDDIVTKLRFSEGDHILYLFRDPKLLNHLNAITKKPVDSGPDAAALYGKIFEALRNNAYIEARQNVNPFDFETTEDIFDDVIIEYFKSRVEKSCDGINVKGILQAIKLEYDVKAALEISETSESLKAAKSHELSSADNRKKYISGLIQRCNNLASPGIKKKDQDEEREVAAIACSISTEDGNGLRVADFIPKAIKSDTVSKYELHFFRSVYNITPIQIAKMCAPTLDENYDEFDEVGYGSEGSKYAGAGDYFRIYQTYMDKIGPDSRTSAIITPHADMRWNAICTLPELDIDYQKRLMKKIHKSMIYGFIYDRIKLYPISDEDRNDKVYRYLNEDEYKVDLKVSNGTKCDILYEVLNSLYFDRLAVSVLRDYIADIRLKNRMNGFTSYEESDFFRAVESLSRKKIANLENDEFANDKISLFEIVLMYCNSLPVQSKDDAEMKTMIEAIIEMVTSEMRICTSNEDSVKAKVALYLIDQFNLLVENYKKNNDRLRSGIFSDDVIDTTRSAIGKLLKRNDLLKYKDRLANFEIN
ncbi:MAG: hypothetical protein J1F23_03980 [Oscillospiraceae bacterium]|nr:hypothetical protein [Oscillospiraceae bacterium]